MHTVTLPGTEIYYPLVTLARREKERELELNATFCAESSSESFLDCKSQQNPIRPAPLCFSLNLLYIFVFNWTSDNHKITVSTVSSIWKHNCFTVSRLSADQQFLGLGDCVHAKCVIHELSQLWPRPHLHRRLGYRKLHHLENDQKALRRTSTHTHTYHGPWVVTIVLNK